MTDKSDRIRKSNRKGELGEYKLDVQFSQLPKEYRYLNDLLLKTDWGYSQIDHVVLSPAGVFVIETKNYFGAIFGKKNDKTWTVCSGPKKFSPYNPISQNSTHLKVLQKILHSFTGLRFYSIISFTRRCTLTGVDLDLRTADSDVMVVYDTEISRFIARKSHLVLGPGRKPSVSTSDIDHIYTVLSKANITDEKARLEHLKKVQQMKKST